MRITRNYLISFLKNLALILSWIVFSPFFLFLSVKWKRPKLVPRIILTTIAPLTLITVMFVSWQGYSYYYYQIKRGSRSEIEAKTGLNFPKYKTIEKRQRINGISFTGDFTMEYTVELDTVNIETFYGQIINEIESNHPHGNDSIFISWDNGKGNYSFSYIDFREHLELKINSETGEMNITYGSL